MPIGKTPLFWDEVASRHNKRLEEAQKDVDYAADAYDTTTTEGKKKVKKAEKKLKDAAKGRY